jgi:hypothetical protein
MGKAVIQLFKTPLAPKIQGIRQSLFSGVIALVGSSNRYATKKNKGKEQPEERGHDRKTSVEKVVAW